MFGLIKNLLALVRHSSHSRRRLRAFGCRGFERLEDRRVLATLAFDAPVNLPIPGTSTPATGDVVVGDFNENGNPDIITYFNDGAFPFNQARIAVFPTTGPATFASPTTLTQTPGCWASPNGTMQVGDFDSDGHLDFSMTHGGSNAFCFGNKVTSHLGDGAGNFALAQTFSTGGSIAVHIVGDFTNDNRQDLVVPTHDNDRTFLHRGDGTGTFLGGSAVIFNVESSALVAHDFNTDGNLDLAAGEPFRGRNSVRVYYGDGLGGLSLAQNIPLATPDGLVGADMDNDGILDLVATSGSTGNVSFLQGLAGGTFAAPVTINTGLSTFHNEPVVADLDLDGNKDLVVGDGASALHVLAGDGNGGFGSPQTVSLGAGSTPGAGLKAADLNLDGRPDLVTTGSNGVYYRLNATQTNRPPVAVDDSYEIHEDGTLVVPAAAGVINNDSDPDLDPLSVSQTIIAPSNGSLDLNADGSFRYTPLTDFNGIDQFVYGVSDGNGGLAAATVTITVLSTDAQIDNVFSDVNALVTAGTLNNGLGNALTSELDNAGKMFDKGKTDKGIKKLEDFIKKVEAFINGGFLDDEGEDLIDQIARAIVSAG